MPYEVDLEPIDTRQVFSLRTIKSPRLNGPTGSNSASSPTFRNASCQSSCEKSPSSCTSSKTSMPDGVPTMNFISSVATFCEGGLLIYMEQIFSSFESK